MRNILFTICFDGSAFSGWQIQRNAPTVQQAFQQAFSALFGSCPDLKGCSRTDAGVHANMFCLSMKTPLMLPCERFVAALNSALPETVAVTSCREVPEDFHARYDCTGKEYRYKIWNSPIRDPFSRRYALHYPRPLPESLLHESAQFFLGVHDFSAFCSAGSGVKDTVRTMTGASVVREGDWVTFCITGNGFLYNMVRIMTGTLLGVAQGKLAPGDIPAVIDSCDRARAGITAPPQGLYLHRVYYDGLSQ